MGYRHLTIDERESILKMLSEQKDMTHIAESIGRDKGTISRERKYQWPIASVFSKRYRFQQNQRRRD